MTSHLDLSDDAFFAQMETGELRKKSFSHSAHIRLACLYIARYGLEEAEQTCPSTIKRYVTRIGMADKYHHTISIASIRLMDYYLSTSGASSFDDLVEKHPEILDDYRAILMNHYSAQIFDDIEARKVFIEPTKNPFPVYSMPTLFQNIHATCDQLATQFDQISDDRKALLKSLSAYVAQVFQKEQRPQLIVICTHNSRRSHMGQLWLSAAAEYYGLSEVKTFSGGTEGTAFYPSAVGAMRTVGFQIVGNPADDNPRYQIQWKSDMEPYVAFSTRFNDAPNPTADFGAIMVCTSADEACPIVFGADFRVALPFNDPKAYDGTALESAKYLERSHDIGREMLYVMSLVK